MYINRKFYENYVSSRDIELLHEYTIRVLNKIGVSFMCKEALDIFRAHGAKVEGQIVKFNETLLNRALESIPSTFSIYTPDNVLAIGERFRPKTVGCYGPSKFLQENGSYRNATMEDVIRFLKLMETSEVTDFANNAAFDTPDLDKSKDEFYLPQVALCLKYSTKPTYGNVVNPLNTRNKNIKEAARSITRLYKGFYDIWDKPVLLTNTCATSPLSYSTEVVENILGLVEESQPVTIVTCSMSNMTAPASLLGTVIQNNATILAGIVLTQLINPGVPVIYGSVSSVTDMRAVSLSIGAPEAQLIQMASLSLARYYHIPVRVGVAGTDSIKPDYQAGMETFMTLMVTYLGKSDFVLHHAGILQSYAMGSYEKFILDEEVNRILLRLNQGIDISESKSQKVFNDMQKAGPSGNYLTGRTPKEYREEHYLTSLFNRKAGDPQAILDEDGDVQEKTHKIIKERLQSYQLPELDQKQKNILNQYLPDSEKF